MIRESIERLSELVACVVFSAVLIVLMASIVGIVQWK